MTPFEYVLPLVSILVGLAVGDLSVCLHHLLRARRRVRWDWLPLLAALLVLLLVLEFWWAFLELGRAEIFTRYWAFLLVAALLVVMFLLASAALPDSVPEEGVDLGAYYQHNRTDFWVLFALFTVLAGSVDFLAELHNTGVRTGLLRGIPNLCFSSLLGSLGFVRRRGYHAVLVPLLTLFLLWQWSQLRLG